MVSSCAALFLASRAVLSRITSVGVRKPLVGSVVIGGGGPGVTLELPF